MVLTKVQDDDLVMGLVEQALAKRSQDLSHSTLKASSTFPDRPTSPPLPDVT